MWRRKREHPEPNYYPLVFRAVSRLPNNTREARQELYNKARGAQAAQLVGREAPVYERERRALGPSRIGLPIW